MGMTVRKVADPAFKAYGRVITGYDFSGLLMAMEHERQAVPGEWLVRRRPRQGKQGKELCGISSGKDGYKLERQAKDCR